MNEKIVRRAGADFGWEGVERLAYKEAGSAPFRDISRQVLFDDAAGAAQWRYFEIAAGGHSSLERHEHGHAVMVLRGRGRCLVGDTVHALAERDLVRVPPLTWHQFRAAADAPLGFLCLVPSERDRPQLPDDEMRARLARDPAIAAFFAGGDDA